MSYRNQGFREEPKQQVIAGGSLKVLRVSEAVESAVWWRRQRGGWTSKQRKRRFRPGADEAILEQIVRNKH